MITTSLFVTVLVVVRTRAYYSSLNLQPTSDEVVLKLIEEINPEKSMLSLWCSTRFHFSPLISLIYANNMVQSAKCDLYQYAADCCLVYTGKDIKIIEENLNNNFNSLFKYYKLCYTHDIHLHLDYLHLGYNLCLPVLKL